MYVLGKEILFDSLTETVISPNADAFKKSDGISTLLPSGSSGDVEMDTFASSLEELT